MAKKSFRAHFAALLAAASMLCAAMPCAAQLPHRTRLIMKDGSYQWVLRYTVAGNRVRFVSAERDASTEEIPLALVDLPATKKWALTHAAQKGLDQTDPTQRPVLNPELAREEAALAARTPEVLPGLKLPEEASTIALDTFHGHPELVPLQQKGSGLNPETAHDTLAQQIDPESIAHDIYDLRGATADVRLHTPRPVIYVRIGTDDESDPGGSAFVVNTHGATGRAAPTGGSATSGYVLEKLRVKSDTREVDSFRINWLGERPQPDLIETTADLLPGGKWLKLTPTSPLENGEYALIEVIGYDKLNLDVWDFAIDPAATESPEALHPEAVKPIQLERRHPD